MIDEELPKCAQKARRKPPTAAVSCLYEPPGRRRLAPRSGPTHDHRSGAGIREMSAYIMTTWRGMDYVEALRAFAPVTNHLHVHDSFGRPTTMAGFYTHAERIAFGMGDLH